MCILRPRLKDHCAARLYHKEKIQLQFGNPKAALIILQVWISAEMVVMKEDQKHTLSPIIPLGSEVMEEIMPNLFFLILTTLQDHW